MKSKSLPLSLAAFLTAISIPTQLASAAVIYDITAGTDFGENGANSGVPLTGPTFTDNLDGTFTLSNASNSGNNNAVFVNSSDEGTVAGILGRSLSASDVVTISVVVDSSTINPLANGHEFGLVVAAGFRQSTDPNLLLQVDDGNNRGGRASFFSTNGTAGPNTNRTETPGATEASRLDGFTMTAVYDATGITYTVSDIIPANTNVSDTFDASSYTFFYTDANYVTNFTTLVGDSFAYFSHQKGGTGTDSVISEFSIDVIPEPTSASLIALASCLMLRRRRR